MYVGTCYSRCTTNEPIIVDENKNSKTATLHCCSWQQLPPTLRRNIPAYNALTGCDTVSQLNVHMEEIPEAVMLDHLGRGALSEASEKQAEEFICRVYSPCTNDAAINEVRYRLFQKDTKYREKLPPTQSCFSKHIQRAHPQSHVWCLADNTSPDHTSPINNGWYKYPTSGQLHPQLMVEDSLPQEFTDIVYCKCKNCATARCTCRSKQLKYKKHKPYQNI